MRTILFIFFAMIATNCFAQEKPLWAKSFLGEKAPALVVEKWMGDKPDTDAKFVLIDFWATWCGPCKKSIKDLNQYHKKFKDKLVIIGISDEPAAKVSAFKNPVITYYSAIDTQKRLNKIYEVRGIPHAVLINPEGIVVWEGWPDLQGFELTEKRLEELLKVK